MPFTPAHVSAVRGNLQNQEQIQWKENVNKIRQLCQSRKYKQCIAVCEEILKKSAAHPLHKAFLHYFVAICDESLGISAHDYSSNKLNFLILSRDHFALALSSLPSPFRSSESGQYDSPETSPSQVDHILPNTTSTPTPPQLSEDETSSDTESEYADSVTDFHSVRPMSASPCAITPERKVRFRQSLSTTHVVQEELIPKPLFKKQKATLDPPASQIQTRQPAMRNTALPRVDESPITPRFAQIRATFAHKPTPNRVLSNTSPRPEVTNPHLSAYLTSPPLTAYNATLTSFQAQLLAHIASVEQMIDATTEQQAAHRRNKYSRLASFWSLREEDAVARERRDRVERLRGEGWWVTKERHGWKGAEYYRAVRERALREIL